MSVGGGTGTGETIPGGGEDREKEEKIPADRFGSIQIDSDPFVPEEEKEKLLVLLSRKLHKSFRDISVINSGFWEYTGNRNDKVP